MALIEGGSILSKHNLRPPALTSPDGIAAIIMTTLKQLF